MNAPPRYLVLCAVLVFVYATTSGAAEHTSTSPGPTGIRIGMKDGLLTLETHDAPLHEVMRGIGELAGFKTILVEDFIEPPLINVSFNNILVREAVERLLSDKNRIIFYTPAEDEAEQRVISQIWLLGSSDASGNGEAGDDETIVLTQDLQHDEGDIGGEAVLRLSNQAILGLSKNDVKGPALGRFSKMLLEDQGTLVRIRAAIALGLLRDERAVPALESALLDKHSAVRLRAINALGQIGGERAIMVLGNILLHGSKDKTERVMAAQALWKHDSEAARGYLSAGAYDVDAQVRLASSKPLSPPKLRATSDQLGDAEAQ